MYIGSIAKLVKKDYSRGMLTKDDLSQIKVIVQDETRKIVKEEIDPLKKDVKTLKIDVSVIRKDIKQIVTFFDHGYLELRERVENIEQHLGINYPR